MEAIVAPKRLWFFGVRTVFATQMGPENLENVENIIWEMDSARIFAMMTGTNMIKEIVAYLL